MRPDVVALARGWLGTPYRHQASLKGVGCDCLGLVRGVYAEAYGRPAEEPPPYSRDWAEAAGRETMIEAAERHLCRVELADAQTGDVLIFRFRVGAMAKHCGVITGLPLGVLGASGAMLADRDQTNVAQAGQREAVAERASGASPAKIIHAIEGAPVCEIWLSRWWLRRIAAVFRFPDLETPTCPTPSATIMRA